MLKIESITKSFDSQQVLKNINLTVESGEILCLLGASGSGKTTLMRIIAGLETADAGAMSWNDEPFTNIPVHRRNFGLMFQDFALFPHMDVSENIAFGLKMSEGKLTAPARSERVQQVLELVGLTDFDNRDVAELSGGERQRVALARSLAPQPRLLMLDEPLGSLDAALRERLVVELRDIIKTAGITAIYVTHDQQEAFAVADRIAVMHDGKIEQIASPMDLYFNPRTHYVASFLGLKNVFPVLEYTEQKTVTTIGNFSLAVTSPYLLLHSDGIQIVKSGQTEILGVIKNCVFLGDKIGYDITVYPDTNLIAYMPSFAERLPDIGEHVSVQIDQWAIKPIEE